VELRRVYTSFESEEGYERSLTIWPEAVGGEGRIMTNDFGRLNYEERNGEKAWNSLGDLENRLYTLTRFELNALGSLSSV
jgi:hypothetical protein